MKTGILLLPATVLSVSIKNEYFHGSVNSSHTVGRYGGSERVSLIVDLTGDMSRMLVVGGWNRFEGANSGDSTVYVVNKVDDISDHTALIDKSNRFLAKDTHESIYWDPEEKSWIKQTYDLNLDIGEKLVELEACIDTTHGDSGSLSRSTSYSVSLSDSSGVSFAAKVGELDISFFLNLFNPELELALTVSFKTSATCDVKKGEYGRLLSVFTTATTRPFGRTMMELKGTKFVPTGENTLVFDIIEYFVDKMPQTICHRSDVPC